MLARLVVVLATALLGTALTAPPAAASHASGKCGFVAFSQSTVTGPDTWEGIAVGYVVGNVGESVSVRCVVKVDGAVRATTSWSSGTTTALVAERVTYVRTRTQATQLCAQYTTAHGSVETCYGTVTVQVLPQEVVDALDAAIDLLTEVETHFVDGATCPVLQSLNGSYGPMEIKPGTGGTGGDVYVNGQLYWDCPSYEPDAEPHTRPWHHTVSVTYSI